MRLYLSSYLWGNQPEKLFELIDPARRHALLLTNSADQFPEAGIIERFKEDQQYLDEHGITSKRLDLREYFEPSRFADLQTIMKKAGLIWVRGANVFVLRRAMAQSGFDKLITDMLNNDEIVYGGYSAGSCVMGTTLRGLELVDDADVTPDRYSPDIIWDGLNILPFAIAPHYKSAHPETELIDKSITYYESNNIQYKALRDGEAIVVSGTEPTVVT